MPDIFFSRAASFVLKLAFSAALLGGLACNLLRQTLYADILILVALTLVIAKILLEGRKTPTLPRRNR
jgi:hypothetical protein